MNINTYNKVIYESHPVKFNEFMNNKYNYVHKEMFEYANKKAYESFKTALEYYIKYDLNPNDPNHGHEFTEEEANDYNSKLPGAKDTTTNRFVYWENVDIENWLKYNNSTNKNSIIQALQEGTDFVKYEIKTKEQANEYNSKLPGAVKKGMSLSMAIKLNESQRKKLETLKTFFYMFDTYETFKEYVSIIEYYDKEYWKFPHVLWKMKIYPFYTISIQNEKYENNHHSFWLSSSIGKMSLEYWWNKCTEEFTNESLKKQYKGYEITYINYVSGKAILYNRQKDHSIEISVNDIRGNVPLSDSYSRNNTFTELYYK